jgi:hypothetical protein
MQSVKGKAPEIQFVVRPGARLNDERWLWADRPHAIKSKSERQVFKHRSTLHQCEFIRDSLFRPQEFPVCGP